MESLKKLYKSDLTRFQKQKEAVRRLWNIDEKTAELLYFMVLCKQPKRILEIGTSNGYSTFWLSLAAEKSRAEVHTIEVDESRFLMAKDNLQTRSNVILYFGKAENIIPSLDFTFDFVFIDAGKINYIDYIKLILPKLNHLATIIADNVISHRETIKEYLDFVHSHSQMDSVELEIGDGLELSVFHKQKE
jgi:predicted O-methyltransferase YrrM